MRSRSQNVKFQEWFLKTLGNNFVERLRLKYSLSSTEPAIFVMDGERGQVDDILRPIPASSSQQDPSASSISPPQQSATLDSDEEDEFTNSSYSIDDDVVTRTFLLERNIHIVKLDPSRSSEQQPFDVSKLFMAAKKKVKHSKNVVQNPLLDQIMINFFYTLVCNCGIKVKCFT